MIDVTLTAQDMEALQAGGLVHRMDESPVIRIVPPAPAFGYCTDCCKATKRMPDGRCMECMRHGRAPAHEPSPPEIGADPQRELACNIVKIRERVLEHGQCLQYTTTNLGRLLSQVADLEHQLCEHEHRGPQGSDLRG